MFWAAISRMLYEAWIPGALGLTVTAVVVGGIEVWRNWD